MKSYLLVLVCIIVACQALEADPTEKWGILEARFLQNDTAAAAGPSCSESQLCKNNGTCTSGTCTCQNGFSGTLCEIDPCQNVKCQLNEVCKAGKCEGDPCLRVNCLNGGTCSMGVCSCVQNFTGPFCQQHPCDNIKCINGGFCMAPGVCHCLNRFTGKFCENSPCANVTCLNNGKCLFGECQCMPEWSGLRCERPSEAARDYKMYNDQLNKLSQNISDIGNRMTTIHNVTNPVYVSAQLRAMIRELQDTYINKIREDSKRDWMTPKVIGIVPVTHKDMRMPNTPMENAKIYEDRDLAYKKAREIKDKKLAAALNVVTKYDEQRVQDAIIIAKDVPGAEYFRGPFGGFTEIAEKYNGVDNSLLEADLDAYHREQEEMHSLINN